MRLYLCDYLTMLSQKGDYEMKLRYDNSQDSKATPTKRTGSNNKDESETVDQTQPGSTPEIIQPDPSTATPHIPEEMPPRELR